EPAGRRRHRWRARRRAERGAAGWRRGGGGGGGAPGAQAQRGVRCESRIAYQCGGGRGQAPKGRCRRWRGQASEGRRRRSRGGRCVPGAAARVLDDRAGAQDPGRHPRVAGRGGAPGLGDGQRGGARGVHAAGEPIPGPVCGHGQAVAAPDHPLSADLPEVGVLDDLVGGPGGRRPAGPGRKVPVQRAGPRPGDIHGHGRVAKARKVQRRRRPAAADRRRRAQRDRRQPERDAQPARRGLRRRRHPGVHAGQAAPPDMQLRGAPPGGGRHARCRRGRAGRGGGRRAVWRDRDARHSRGRWAGQGGCV
ncbi:hypothetical protein IWQ57_004192, partial [Coemansia nantahalensis]